MTDTQSSITDQPGYTELFSHLSGIVERSPQPQLAAAGLLNASTAIMLGLVGPDVTADTLRRAADQVPATLAEVQAKLA